MDSSSVHMGCIPVCPGRRSFPPAKCSPPSFSSQCSPPCRTRSSTRRCPVHSSRCRQITTRSGARTDFPGGDVDVSSRCRVAPRNRPRHPHGYPQALPRHPLVCPVPVRHRLCYVSFSVPTCQTCRKSSTSSSGDPSSSTTYGQFGVFADGPAGSASSSGSRTSCSRGSRGCARGGRPMAMTTSCL
jgi:hypothetical protein